MGNDNERSPSRDRGGVYAEPDEIRPRAVRTPSFVPVAPPLSESSTHKLRSYDREEEKSPNRIVVHRPNDIQRAMATCMIGRQGYPKSRWWKSPSKTFYNPFAGTRLDKLEKPEQVRPTIANIFWLAFLFSPLADHIFQGASVSRRADQFVFDEHGVGGGLEKVFVVPNDNGDFYAHDLAVLSQEISGEKIIIRDLVDLRKRQDVFESLRIGWENFLKRIDATPASTTSIPPFLLMHGVSLAYELFLSQPCGVVFFKSPSVILTEGDAGKVPVPAVKICHENRSPVATAGVIAQNKKGKIGVTTALHALTPKPERVWVDDLEGFVESTDLVSDSCFIEVPALSMTQVRRTNGILSGMTPRHSEPATFCGITSGEKDTHIIGWSPSILYYHPNLQNTVITRPATNKGDSGAALISRNDNRVIGFAFLRSDFGEPVEFSSWIWAESVYRANSLDLHGRLQNSEV